MRTKSKCASFFKGGCKSRRRFKDKQQEVKMHDEECKNCNGSGSVRNDGRYKYSVECDTVDCPVCNGSGIAPPEPDYEDFIDSVECDTVDCPVCNGSGIAPPEPDYEDFIDIT
jgi:DnaJ-class molecular chaperone